MDTNGQERLLNLGSQLAERVPPALTKLEADSPAEYAYRGAILFFFCKGYKSYQAFRLLWEKRYEEDATVLSRTLFEAMLQSVHILEDPARARAFLEFDAVERYRRYLKIKRRGDNKELLESIESRAEELEELRETYENLKDKYQGRNWWGGTIESLAENQGLLAKYDLMYWTQSNLVHSGVVAVSAYFGETPDGLWVNCYPREPREDWVPIEATLYLVRLIDAVNTAFDLGILDHIRDAVGELMDIVGEVGGAEQ